MGAIVAAVLFAGWLAFNTTGCSKACAAPTPDSPAGCSTAFVNAEKVVYRVAETCPGKASCDDAGHVPPSANMRYVPFAGGAEGLP